MRDRIKNILHILFREKHPPVPVVAALFENEEDLLNACQQIQNLQLKNAGAISPYPIHGIDDLLNIKRSWIPWVTFIFGLIGMFGGGLLTWWTSAVDWPLIIGGKPFFSLPAFIPVIFECTILFSALASVVACFYACGIPKVDPPVLDSDLTSHKFALYFETSSDNVDDAKKKLSQLKAQKIITGKF